MNRRYTIEEFKEAVKLLRKTYPNVSLTTDIIVGFPGETDEEFDITFKNLQEIKFYKMHVFKYSQRKGTVAAKMLNQVDGKVKDMRSKKLIKLSNENEEQYNKKYIGKEVEVLFEEPYMENEEQYMKGHTTNYMVVKMKANENLENKIKKVKIFGAEKLQLIAKEGA